jgi:hypothetical protein
MVWTRRQETGLHHVQLTYHARQPTLSEASLTYEKLLLCVHSTPALDISSLPRVLCGRYFSTFQIEETDFYGTTTEPWRSMMLPMSFCLLVAYVTSTLLYRLYLHPLARYPGSFRARLSSIPSWWQTRKQNRHLWLLSLQQKYGMRYSLYFNGVQRMTTKNYR